MPGPGPQTVAAAELAAALDGDRATAVEFGEYASASTLLIEELGGVPFGAPPAWRKAVIAELDARDIATLRPFALSRPEHLPSCLCVLPHRTLAGFAPLEDDLERIASIPPDLFAAQLPDDPNWREVRRAPARWLDAFAGALRRSCGGLRVHWTAAAGLLERDAERVGAAIARGATRELVTTRFPARLLKLQGPTPHGAELRPRLGLVPMLAGPRAAHVWIIDGVLTHVVYPLPQAWQLVDGMAPAPASLGALLGLQRALVLRLLDRPRTAGEIADALTAVPSAASHHLAILERAGLVSRERSGRHVQVRRTARGSELLALYDEA